MTRWFIALCVIALWAAPADAEPPAKAKADATKPAAKKALDLQAKPAKRATTRATTIDLFPESVLGKSKRTAEKRRGIPLGDDSHWKVHAAQVGAMAALFGTLAALCHGGKCMVPEAATNALPSWLRAKPPVVNDPRPPQKLRQAR